jgi:DNA-binding beta-propeller fold protein YncE
LKVVKNHGQVNVQVLDMIQIASGYAHAPNAAAVVVGPGGLAYNPQNHTLYVASIADNAIYAISHANRTRTDNGTGAVVYKDQAHLRGPIGLTLAPNGDLLTTNGDAVNGDPNFPSELIEFTPSGQFIGQLPLDPAQDGGFGLVALSNGKQLTVATVDDNINTLDLRTINGNGM